MDTKTPTHFTNRLAQEKSPYLLQHQHNPVDWFAWGEEAFAEARTAGKPIFLSIGYSTCHWCHVMERESFENPEIAEFLNRCFVSIKVDREERPDIDKVYMAFVQATTGQGGWPLNLFLTPNLKPFYGGTYFPPETRFGRPGFLSILQNVADLWESKRGEIKRSADQLHQQMVRLAQAEPKRGPSLAPALLHHAARQFKEQYDRQNGGFGGAPKFPRPSEPSFLLQYGVHYRDPEALRMVFHTCQAMADGGIHDHLGGGFARYSVDAQWLVPHFEKMLYDNAQLAELYIDAGLASGQTHFFATARDTLDYLLRDMRHPLGGFYSAEDADSEGKEGKFYLWTETELKDLLTQDEFSAAVRYFGVTAHGNFIDHSDPSPLPGQNVLSVVDSQLSPVDQSALQSAKQKMFAARTQRPRPHCDDKILTSWNGMILSSLARASAVLGVPSYLDASVQNFHFLRDRLWDPVTHSLFHRWREEERDNVQLAEDYAQFLSGTLQLYQVTLSPSYLDFAILLAESLLKKFFDSRHGGFWQNRRDTPDLVVHLKDDYDGAEPSGNAAATIALLKLAALTGREDFRSAARKTLRRFGHRLKEMPQATPVMLAALDLFLQEPKRVVITGPEDDPRTHELLHAAHSVYVPGLLISGHTGPVDAFIQPSAAEKPAAFFCAGTACQLPTDDPRRLVELLKGVFVKS